jgi:hypothetical protein
MTEQGRTICNVTPAAKRIPWPIMSWLLAIHVDYEEKIGAIPGQLLSSLAPSRPFHSWSPRHLLPGRNTFVILKIHTTAGYWIIIGTLQLQIRNSHF